MHCVYMQHCKCVFKVDDSAALGQTHFSQTKGKTLLEYLLWFVSVCEDIKNVSVFI